jgi:hypothetical protein
VPPVAGRGVGTKEKGEADSRSSRLRLESRRSFALGVAVPSTPGCACVIGSCEWLTYGSSNSR